MSDLRDATNLPLPSDSPDDFPAPLPVGFLSLPPELRLQVYAYILANITIDLPPLVAQAFYPESIVIMRGNLSTRRATVHQLYHYRGLIMSNRQIHAEFDVEWAKLFNPWLQELVASASLIAQTVTRLKDSAGIDIKLKCPAEGYLGLHHTSAHAHIPRLVKHLPSLCLHPDPVTCTPRDIARLITDEPIKRLRGGAKGKNVNHFLHGMKLVAVQVVEEKYVKHGRDLLMGEEYGIIGFNYAWKEVVEWRKGNVMWDIVEWRKRLFGIGEKKVYMGSGDAWEWDGSLDE
jgi:hypothetical protein